MEPGKEMNCTHSSQESQHATWGHRGSMSIIKRQDVRAKGELGPQPIGRSE